MKSTFDLVEQVNTQPTVRPSSTELYAVILLLVLTNNS